MEMDHVDNDPPLSPNDLQVLRDLLNVFGNAFHDRDTYTARRPSDEYLHSLLGGESFS